ncbi:tubulin delta chain-like [Styela clava]
MTSSSVLVQLGQCGTQLGHNLLDTIYQDAVECPLGFSASQNERYHRISTETYFKESKTGFHEARAVTVDMEPKVVNQAIESARRSGKWTYPAGMQLCRKSGSGNNWSYGFQIHGSRCENEVLSLLRKEAEKCDRLSGFIVVMSLAGGTGSGLGSYVVQLIKDNFPHSVILNPIVMPYKAGEVAVQNYNAVLTLSCVLTHADASVLLHNDHLHNVCSKSLNIDKVSINHLNTVAAHQLASVLQPADSLSNNSLLELPYKRQDILFDIVRSTSCHSQYKILTLRSVPHLADRSIAFSTFNWPSLLKRMKQMHLTNFFVDEGMDWQVRLEKSMPSYTKQHSKSLGNMLFLRGEGAGKLTENDFQEFFDSRLYASWVPSDEQCHIWSTQRRFRQYEKSVSMLSNNSFCTEGLDTVINKAWNMFTAKAYLHQYTKYGLEEEDFLNAFVKVENVVNSYRKL